MTLVTKNFGLVRAIQVGTTAPSNIQMLWYDTNPGQNIQRYFNVITLTWDPLINSSTTSLSALTDVLLTTPALNQVLTFDGSKWINQALPSSGITTLGGQVGLTQLFAVGTAGTDFAISSATNTHTFNLPTASSTNRGALSATDWTTFNNKQATISLTTTGNSGSATFVADTLNVPTYTLAGLGGIGFSSLSATSPISYNGAGVFSHAVSGVVAGTYTSVTVNATGHIIAGTNPAPTGWQVTGNSGLVDLTNNYWGTTDDIPVNILHNNQRSGRIDNVNQQTFFGYLAGGAAATTFATVAVGHLALSNSTDADNSVAVGTQALLASTTGYNNTAVGHITGATNVTGIGNLYLGYGADADGSAYSNSAAIGYNSVVGASDSMVFGNNLVSIGFGISSPTAKIHAVSLGSTDATYAQIIENSSNDELFKIRDDGYISAGILNGSLTIGYGAGFDSLYTGNTLIGVGSGGAGNIAESSNTAVGINTLYSIGASRYNVAIGDYALYSATTGDVNTAIGSQALYTCTTGGRNVAVGGGAMFGTTTGSYNIGIGYQAMYSAVTGANNTGIGQGALYALTSGSANIGLGSALGGNTTGNSNIAIGETAMQLNTTGSYNIAMGQYALRDAICSYSIAMGYRALFQLTSGDNNISIGSYSMYNNLTGANNLAIGYQSGEVNTGSGSVFLGYRSGDKETASNKLFIDNQSRGTEAAGRTDALMYGIFNASPALQYLTVNGAFRVGRFTTAEEGALTAANGMIIYNTDTNKFRGYENGAWVNLI